MRSNQSGSWGKGSSGGWKKRDGNGWGKDASKSWANSKAGWRNQFKGGWGTSDGFKKEEDTTEGNGVATVTKEGGDLKKRDLDDEDSRADNKRVKLENEVNWDEEDELEMKREKEEKINGELERDLALIREINELVAKRVSSRLLENSCAHLKYKRNKRSYETDKQARATWKYKKSEMEKKVSGFM